MFETNNEVVKFWGGNNTQKKLVAVKIRKAPNRKKKNPTDPDFLVMAVVDIATFDPRTNKQIESISSYLSMNEFYEFIEVLQYYGRKAMHIHIAKSKKMPAVELFNKMGGTDLGDSVISRKLSFSNAGPDMNAEFFVAADEAPGHKDERGLYVRNKGAKSTKWISMSMSSAQTLAMARACESAIQILNMWSALGTLWQNLDRVDPRSSSENTRKADYAPAQPRPQMPQQEVGYVAQGGGAPVAAASPAPQRGYNNNAGYGAQGQQQGYIW